MGKWIVGLGFAIFLLAGTGAQASCITYNSSSGFWDNNCSYPAIVTYHITGGRCGFGSGSGTAGPVQPHSSGAYNPTLKGCGLRWASCDYNAWTAGRCRLH